MYHLLDVPSSSNSIPFSTSQLRIRANAPELMQYYPVVAECKYYHQSVAEVIVGTNLITERPYSFALSPQCATQQLTFGRKHRELFLLSQVRDQRTLNKIKNLIWYCFALLLHLLEICSIDQFVCTFIPTIMSSFVVCPLISLIDRFRVRKSIAAFGAFLFHI